MNSAKDEHLLGWVFRRVLRWVPGLRSMFVHWRFSQQAGRRQEHHLVNYFSFVNSRGITKDEGAAGLAGWLAGLAVHTGDSLPYTLIHWRNGGLCTQSRHESGIYGTHEEVSSRSSQRGRRGRFERFVVWDMCLVCFHCAGVGAVCCTYRTYNLVATETSQRKHKIMSPPQNAYTNYIRCRVSREWII